jgi:hypothetical protein
MHDWMVTLSVQVQPGVNEPPIVIKVEMSDRLYTNKAAGERCQLVKQIAMETLVAAKHKIWATPTAPVSIDVTALWPITKALVENDPPDHSVAPQIYAWVKQPTSPFPSQ